jgi:hypothetical protein
VIVKHLTTGFICNVALDDMVTYEQMIAQGIQVIDAKGNKVPSVRAIKEASDGVHVLALMMLRDSIGAVIGGCGNDAHCVEFYAFVKGARVVQR